MLIIINKNKLLVIKMQLLWLLFWTILCLSYGKPEGSTDIPSIYYTEPSNLPDNNVATELNEVPGGHIISGERILKRSSSPYILKEDLFVEKDGQLIIEPGVEIRFAPMVGITVRGVITAKGESDAEISLTSSETSSGQPESRSIRLVDGPTPLEGRVQLFHKGSWRSVCTNSRNWTRADYEIACRQLGFQGGKWSGWFDRQWPASSRLLYEEPQCRGTESSLQDCKHWSSRQLGAGVCDYHPDLAITCLPFHDGASKAKNNWRGIRFEGASYDNPLTQENTFYVRQSKSILRHVTIKYAGTGRDNNVTSALHVVGVPPRMQWVSILYSSFTGINITSPEAPITITNCTVRSNRGYGIYVNSSTGLTHIDNCVVLDNGADGIKYINHDEKPDDRLDRTDIHDLCTLPVGSSQTFPITVSMEQNYYALNSKECPQRIITLPGHVLTLQFLQMKTDRNDSAIIEVYDGTSASDKLLGRVFVRNGTLPQSITTTRHNLYLKFNAQPRTQMIAFVKLSAGYKKLYDLNVTSSAIANNNGRGIAAEKLRSLLHVHDTSVSNNNHIAGIHVFNGVPDVNITSSRISYNYAAGINITVTGGNRNISHTTISSNKGYGLAVWLNDSTSTEYLHFNQTTVVEYSEIFRNRDIGVLVGNSTGLSYVNITGNCFNSSSDTAVQIESSWKYNQGTMYLQIGHNVFIENNKLGVKLSPVLNIKGKIEYNQFSRHNYGGLLIRNPLFEEFNILPAHIIIQYNYFDENRGVFVASIGLSPYSDVQKIIFTRNYLRDNIIKEPFDQQQQQQQISKLIPRSRVAAVLVISSANVDVYRNILNNLYSQYEIGSHLEDQSKNINCTYNWLSDIDEEKIQERLFDRKDRYNLAKIEYLPYLLHSTNPATNTIISRPTFIPKFVHPSTNLVGGEVDGLEILSAGEYIVERDINVRPGGKLVLKPGVTLKFPPAVGMMVAGKLEAQGKGPSNIMMTLKEEISMLLSDESNDTITNDNNDDGNGVTIIMDDESVTMMTLPPDDDDDDDDTTGGIPVRLLGGRTNREGRLQVRIDKKWGTVCNYGWTIRDAALVCHQLGFTLDPDDWIFERSNIPDAGTNEEIIMSNVQCTDDDIDISKCKAELFDDFEYSCTHENDVGIKCTEAAWAGVRLGPLADRSDLQFITIERAGLLDYTTNSLKPALQIDFARHSLEGIKISNNLQDGLGIIYSDIFSASAENTVKNSYFTDNRGSGISFKQLGLKISNCIIENNKIAGIKHNPVVSAVKQREFAGWFMQYFGLSTIDNPYQPIIIPERTENIDILTGEIKYIVTAKRTGENVRHLINIRCEARYVIGIQLLNPIENRSTEQILLHDSQHINPKSNNIWNVKRDLSLFPVSSSSFTVILEYISGTNALGGAVFVVTTVPRPIQDIPNRIVKGPVPTLSISRTKIKGNKRGLVTSYYNRYLDELGDHYLRKANESIRLVNCEISHNQDEAIYVHSPLWNVLTSNISEITIHINNTLITDNGRGIVQFSRDMRNSNNLFHWVMRDNTIERNKNGGLDISLPYVWQYNENFTHSLYFSNNTWQNNNMFAFIIDGHYSTLNITRNIFDNNNCKNGLISIRGMEKKIKINHNRIEKNNCTCMVEFNIDSQSEILGEIPANFYYNTIKYNNNYNNNNSENNLPSFVVGFNGIQKVKINRNLFGDNYMDYELLAGIRTAKINNKIDVSENWWGTTNDTKIKSMIFDFDDWNNHAIADFKPYLTSDSFDSSISVSWEMKKIINLDNFGGRITDNVELYARSEPYVIKSDITIMPQAVVNIYPGVIMEFAPNVGIVVLGTLNAVGVKEHEIVMRPIKKRKVYENNDESINSNIVKRWKIIDDDDNNNNNVPMTIRLCKDRKCSSSSNEGFIEYFNLTTLQWIPLCDSRFTERNAQVACRQLGYDPLNTYVSHDRRYEFHPGSLTRIWSWPEPIQCFGNEERLEDCKIRLNGQLFGQKYNCPWDGDFVFINCGKRNLDPKYEDYWGGIRVANSEFENHLYEHRFHDIETHETVRRVESILKYINITGAGILHNEKSPAIQAIMKSPIISHVTIEESAYHGINIVSPSYTVELLFNIINNCLGNGINVASLTGEGREAEESSFTPLKDNINIPYNLFSMIDMCDTMKEIEIEERVIIYYKYDNYPVNCVKIFKSAYRAKPFGFRLLQFNLYNSTGKQQPGRPDAITLYDGDISWNTTARLITNIEYNSKNNKKLFTTQGPSLSIKLLANGASGVHGFIAEIVTLPISAIGFNRDVQHNISYSVISNCKEGAVKYASAGEVNAIMTLERNQFVNNCYKFYGNFTTCNAAVVLDVQNTQSLYFRNNLIRNNNGGGLFIRSDSRGSATSLKGWIHNNLFSENLNKPALYVEGRQSSPYQEITIYRNYFMKNYAPYDKNIILKQVVSNMSYNYLHANLGLHLLEISGFERVRLPIYQSTTHNGFYKNYAIDKNGRSTVVAGTPGQQIRDRSDSPELLVVKYNPYHTSNKSVLSGKCPPGWDLVGDTCYIYIGAPMDFYSAREFCRIANASMPFIMGQYLELWKFLRRQQERFEYSDRVWIQQLEKVDQCTTFTYQTIEIDHCSQPSPFICEIDPRVYIDPLSWRKDVVAISVLGAFGVAIALLAFAIGFWISKSKKRKVERLERRNSIRQSLHSLRSVGSTSGFTELAYRKKPVATKSTDTLTSRSLDYKKMMSGGSLDSMDKSQLNSSIEDNHSYDVYEAHNPRYSPSTSDFKETSVNIDKYQNLKTHTHVDNPVFDLAYRNDGFRNHSTFTSQSTSNWPSMANTDITPDNNNDDNNITITPPPPPDHHHHHHHHPYHPYHHSNTTSTLPLNTSLATTDSISELKRDIELATPVYTSPTEFKRYGSQEGLDYGNSGDSPTTPISEPVPVYFSPVIPPQTYYYNQRPASGTLLETNLDSAA
ncbi:Similar to bark: Protein bark beetle (Drosophila melanogaster) [Cotesia congregata]|uniref:Similar to bark: Protein bark beetle (Drosophila melanogaster) n=1 Tax=Cotesia congregata TaxID=51543 RepID=A0A8J2HTI2_COTCN|nr:Similar to bark: Protein bark beetle (Drosophila melanogaster) [Cotesia congregata]